MTGDQCSFCGEAKEGEMLYCSPLPRPAGAETCVCRRCAEFAAKTLAELEARPPQTAYVQRVGPNPHLKAST